MEQKQKMKYDKGAAMLIAVILFLFVSSTIVLGITAPILKQARISTDLVRSKESYYYAEGALEDAFYRIKNGKSISSGDTIITNGYTTTITITTASGVKTILAVSNRDGIIRKMQSQVVAGVGASFNYGVQVGLGGFVLENSSTITGNIYSGGPITGAGNTISGDAVSSGSSGLIDDVHITNSAYAHTIQDSDVDANAYYVIKTNTTVGGTSFPNSPDQPVANLPISDEQIALLEADAVAGGVISSPCPYKITSTVTLGPKKITCDLEVSGSAVVTLAGSVWVTGDIDIKNSALIKISSSFPENTSPALIADNPANRSSGSKISLQNTATFQGSGGSGNSDSYIFAISQNNSAETGGTNDAISMKNSSAGEVVLYAGHGQISIENSATLRQVTGYKIKMKNSANLIYEEGLADTLFSSGPSGGWNISTWQEVQ
ncbi:MAG: hypothetical protein UT65_C0034G0002 [Parcubacteria group bacterium GW2011_GWF2_39_8b]|uniref:Type 4 fimbrial biogenesis protein PilX N-terminal domain-containing protein n=2 Tax=Candidatus Zambryskiibacteriota TaxID=1817925 RepID=A0A1G2T7U7_9BACT|nr:MAG: hypothetical protein UT65_C0034G0002 [Parcubacteria group bacterium GW2011_GWF2_39_8b]KKR46172.1 MAG: hypothetical protein UT81_C0001G0019 [Parcubacteria group bacterium GW2011_GWA2_40_14]OHA93098.1 MAG: hypothetical protein A2W58_03425 [Candidatus Zambryskibacteria bacterium RIFCSPHIGHO2_02_38_10.5]OHA95682.1 MAG: hypothetical protein A3C63_00375 [Candidatus Zambryskibacteria bacterium RIFCSPHIGHO2_02_FULL_39_82]OHA98594.1 MAG: hypothetical protein A3E32_03590 [Candidatus Zambryskibact